MELTQAQAELNRLEFIELIREAKARNDGSFLAISVLLHMDHDCPSVLDGYTTEDYQKAIQSLQRAITTSPERKPAYQEAIDYINANFLNEGVVADG